MKMTVAKAIEILDLNVKEAKPKMPPDCEAAVKLGIQALGVIKAWAITGLFNVPFELQKHTIED